MPLHFKYTLTEFTPGEAESITGLRTTMQRDWRRHRYLPSGDGHARFNVLSLAEMMFLKAMSDRGIGPQRMTDIAGIAGGGIAMGALMNDAAYEGDPYIASGQSRAQSVLQQTSKDKVVKRIVANRFLIIFADGTEYWHNDVQLALASVKATQVATRLGGPVIVLDQFTMGAMLFERAGRPLVYVEREDRA